ncbi:CoA transferase [Candidatus Ponderosibacter sp. Uisw_141_02]|uniref:CoA transferase n=1 Tax=Candidatus Ponderosibacter sp. Uisw_141_02 TaxID=3231000 RepID=UPI003D410168
MSAFDKLMAIRDLPLPEKDEVSITGSDPVLNTHFRLAATASAAIAGIGVAVNDLWELKTGRRQAIAIDAVTATAALKSKNYFQAKNANGVFENVTDASHEANRGLTGIFQTKDGRWLLPHFGLDHLRRRMLDLLQADANTESIAKAVAKWDALELENAIDEARVCGGMIRTNEEWLQEPHGKILAAKPVVEIIKIGDSEPEPMPAGDRPLSGIKALDLTRILAGPITGRTLAEHGADVLMVSAPHLPQVWSYVADTSHGKRSCYLDLRDEREKQTLIDLVKTADVFSQGYRPDKINQMGLGPEALAEIRPGLVYVSINCYGADGPFSHRGGWEQIAQIMTGIAAEGVQSSSGYKPKTLPAAANDYITGYLGAYGTLLALARRAREGGSYHVRVSLCQTGMMIYDQGKVGTLPENLNLGMSDVDSLCMESDSHLGRIKHLAPVLSLSETRPYWALPTPKMGSNDPRWLG